MASLVGRNLALIGKMKKTQVEEIIHPFKEGTPLHPSIGLEDKITYAVELMINNDLEWIAVKGNKYPLGMISLSDALEKLGLHPP
jgi:hypothetical protein